MPTLPTPILITTAFLIGLTGPLLVRRLVGQRLPPTQTWFLGEWFVTMVVLGLWLHPPARPHLLPMLISLSLGALISYRLRS